MGKPDISVIVTVYNQDLRSILISLESVVRQRDVACEVVIADDHSEESYERELDAYFAMRAFSAYRYVRQPENLQTVGNLLAALDACEGRYVKELGSGDLLYDDHVLHDIVEHLDATGARVGFGAMRQYELTDGDAPRVCRFNAPHNARSYTGARGLGPQLFKRQVLRADWIPGPSQFYERELYRTLLGTLYRDYAVRFCEDFTAALVLLEEDMAFFDRDLVWYEFGVGISTSASASSVARMYRDHSAFYRGLGRLRPGGSSHLPARFWYRVRRFIALKTPLYAMLHARTARSYQAERDGSEPTGFLLEILATAASMEDRRSLA